MKIVVALFSFAVGALVMTEALSFSPSTPGSGNVWLSGLLIAALVLATIYLLKRSRGPAR